MIIGISGKKQHGKDTLARIFQWKSAVNFVDLKDYAVENKRAEDVVSSITVKKYADKLKDFICMITGCTREQLEDEDFKSSFAPVEFNKVIRGSYASRGGTKIQNEFSYNHNPKFYCIASDKEDTKERKMHDSDKIAYETGNLREFYPEDYHDRNYILEYRRTYRDILQEIGTDLMRKQFSSNIWVDATMVDYKPIFDDVFPTWIITDVRFPNEAEAIKKRGGIVIRVNRPSVISTDTHESETALDDYQDFDYIITNDKFEDLVAAVDTILLNHKI